MILGAAQRGAITEKVRTALGAPAAPHRAAARPAPPLGGASGAAALAAHAWSFC
jgi:hypothetical protein